jgi:lipoate-protein ligase A
MIRFIDTQTQDAAFNMAIDESILLHHLRGDVPPTLRVFSWTQTSISLGRFQNVGRELLQEECERAGIALVRRPTGGRAVYHRDEFTYSFVSSKAYGMPSGVVAAYAHLAQGIIAALGSLGVAAELSDGRADKHPSAACFASSTQADLTSGGFKLVGSAQVWKDDALLQQGSLPLEDRAAEFFSLLRFPDEAAREAALASYNEKTTPLRALLPEVTWEAVGAAFQQGFSTALQTKIQPAELTASEWKLAQELVDRKYRQLVWERERVRILGT